MRIRPTSPSTGRRKAAAFSEGEAVRLVKRAIRMGFPGLACIIPVAWDTQFSPDCRTLTPGHKRDDDDVYFVKFRQ